MQQFLFGVLAGVLVFYFMSQNCLITTSARREKDRIVKTLLRQMGRWHTATQLDPAVPPLIKNLHQNYAVAYWSAIQQIASSEEIERLSDMSYAEIDAEISKEQDQTTLAVIRACPQFAPRPTKMSALGAEGVLNRT